MSTLIRDYERFAKEANEICKGRVYTDHLVVMHMALMRLVIAIYQR